ncbi:MAG TPA: transposase [Gammaproteobacteria bacterium]|nr:transposase [Gammaproteobacteria bacterium]
MVSYRRAYAPGGTWFFTLALANRRATLLVDHADVLRDIFLHVRRRYPFLVHAIAIMPDHLHTVWSLPAGDTDFPGRWRYIKGAFTRQLKKRGVCIEANAQGEHALWQRRYWEHLITDDGDYARHVDYIHANPVKHGYVRAPGEWPWSSFHAHVRDGRLPANWMSTMDVGLPVGPVE